MTRLKAAAAAAATEALNTNAAADVQSAAIP